MQRRDSLVGVPSSGVWTPLIVEEASKYDRTKESEVAIGPRPWQATTAAPRAKHSASISWSFRCLCRPPTTACDLDLDLGRCAPGPCAELRLQQIGIQGSVRQTAGLSQTANLDRSSRSSSRPAGSLRYPR